MSYESTCASMRRIEAANADIESGAHGYIQWKGTNVCMDVYCECGCHSHIDAEFACRVQCPACRRVWHVSPFVRLVRQEEDDGPRGSFVVVGDASLRRADG